MPLDPTTEQAFDEFRDWPDCLKELGSALLEQGRVETALPYFLLYRRIADSSEDVELDAGLLVYQGRCHLALGDKEAAEECFIAAIEADDENIDSRYELAKMYESEQQKDGRGGGSSAGQRSLEPRGLARSEGTGGAASARV